MVGDFEPISGEVAVASGGSRNEASGTCFSTSGGQINRANGIFAAISGEALNTASGTSSWVSGGTSRQWGMKPTLSGGSRDLLGTFFSSWR
jgi:hypothetical protein